MTFSREAVTNAIGDGLLSFPITDFDSQGRFDEASYRKRLEWFISHEISAVFVAGGTGEFFSLSLDEYRDIVRVAVEVIDGRLPVIASAGLSVETGKAFAKAAEEAGADGILLMPPYLTECPQDGLVEYARQICDATAINVIYYNRGNGILNASSVAEAYVSIGVNTYSSAVFNFVPEMAVKFYKELRKGNKEVVKQITNDFFIPFVDLRDRKAGYAVSLIKAGAAIVGRPAGSVRAPLAMPANEECLTLEALIDVAKKY